MDQSHSKASSVKSLALVEEPTADSVLDEHPESKEDLPGLLLVEENLRPTAESVVPLTNKQDAFRGFNFPWRLLWLFLIWAYFMFMDVFFKR